MRLVGGMRRRARLLRQGGDLERPLRRTLEHLARLLGRASVELDQHVDHDSLAVVLVEAHMGEELTHAGVAEGSVGEELDRFRPRAALDPALVDGDRAGGDPRGAGDHPLPAVLDRDDAVALEGQVGLVVHAVQALDHRFLYLVDALGRDPRFGVDAADRVVVDLDLEVLRPAAVAAQPGRAIPVQVVHTARLGRGGRMRLLGDQLDDLAHDPAHLEVLRGVDASDAGVEEPALVGGGDDAADDDRHVGFAGGQLRDDLRHQLGVRAGEDREADHVDILLDRRGDDLLRGQPDPGIDDLHADFPRPQGDLLGAVGVAVEPRLADQDLDPVTDLLGHLVYARAGLVEQLAVAVGCRAADPGRPAIGTEDLAQRLRPLPGGGAGAGGGDRRRHDVPLLRGGDLRQLLEGGLHGRLVAVGAPGFERLDPFALDLRVYGHDAAVLAAGQRRPLTLCERVLSDHL